MRRIVLIKIAGVVLFLTSLILLSGDVRTGFGRTSDGELFPAVESIKLPGQAAMSGEPSEIESLTKTKIQGNIFNSEFGSSVTALGDINGDGNDDIAVASVNYSSGKGRVNVYFGPVKSGTTPKILEGESAGDRFGSSIAGVGDVNRDGFNDLVVGAAGRNGGTGKVYVFFGGLEFLTTAAISVNGENAGDSLGCSVAGTGDVNGDGYDDIIAGANGYSGGTGRVYIYYGGGSLDLTADVILTGENTGDKFGSAVGKAGDVDYNGFNDVLAGAPGFSSNGGKVYLYFGGKPMNNTVDVTMTGENAGDYFGFALSHAGDMNGDFYDDIMVGAYGFSSNRGRVYIYYGSAQPNNTADLLITGAAVNNYFGYAVSSIGDLDANGYSDIAVGAYGYSSNLGRIYIYNGGVRPDSVSDDRVEGETANSGFGICISPGGDFDGLGYNTILAGAHKTLSGKGGVFIYKYATGSQTNFLSFPGFAIDKYFAWAVDGNADVNGDGFPDILISAKGHFASDTAKVYLYLGGESLDVIPDIVFVQEGSTASNFGISASFAGDVNGDGYGDIIIGAQTYNSNRGKVYLYFGGPSMDNIADLTIDGEAANNYYGTSVSQAGDVNNDGYDDFIVGTYLYNTNLGRVYIYYGGNPLNGVADVVVTGTTASINWGQVVSNAGDVNGDGYDDLMWSAQQYSSSTGRVYILYGGAAMDNIIDITLTGTTTGMLFGSSLAPAGDVNGDGYQDIIIGASYYSSQTGRVLIYYGAPTMSTTASVTLTGAATNARFGWAVSSAGDQNGDGNSDVIVTSLISNNGGVGRTDVFYGGSIMDSNPDKTFNYSPSEQYGYSVALAGDHNNDGINDLLVGNNSITATTGNVLLYYSDGATSGSAAAPRILSVKDVPNDQGGRVQINWLRSKYDVWGDSTVSSYIIERSLAPGNHGYSWEKIAELPALYNVRYTYSASTDFDSIDGTLGLYYYRLSARGKNLTDLWRSNIVSGYSVDNLSPAQVLQFRGEAGNGFVKLKWLPNTEQDFSAYYIYRSNLASINPDSVTPLAVVRDTVFTDNNPPGGSVYYFIRAKDVNGNYSSLSSSSNNPLPVELDLFHARVDGRSVILNWRTQTEANMHSYTIERKTEDSETWEKIGESTASGNSNSVKNYSYTDENLNPGKYEYRLEMTENSGYRQYSKTVEAVIGVPREFTLSQNYPNPFNPSTTIEFALPEKAQTVIEIYDVLGGKIVSIMNEEKEAGYYSIPVEMSRFAAGTYIYRIQAGKYTAVRKMMLLK